MRHALTIAVLCLAGCTIKKGFTPGQLAEIEKSRPRCTSDVQCRVMWSRARNWLLSNSSFAIRTATDDLLETFAGRPGDTGLYARITKDAQPDGSSTFDVKVGCYNVLMCSRDLNEAKQSFNDAVNGVKPD